mgnify:CR=1 FL=1
MRKTHRILIVCISTSGYKLMYQSYLEKWGNMDLNHGPAGYESYSPSNSEHNRVNQNHVFLSRKLSSCSEKCGNILFGSSQLRKKCGKFAEMLKFLVFYSKKIRMDRKYIQNTTKIRESLCV